MKSSFEFVYSISILCRRPFFSVVCVLCVAVCARPMRALARAARRRSFLHLAPRAARRFDPWSRASVPPRTTHQPDERTCAVQEQVRVQKTQKVSAAMPAPEHAL